MSDYVSQRTKRQSEDQMSVYVSQWTKRLVSPAVLLILCIQLVGLLSLLGHPPGHQLLVVLCGFPQFLLQSREGDLQGVILVLQGLVCPLQVLQGHRESSSHSDITEATVQSDITLQDFLSEGLRLKT